MLAQTRTQLNQHRDLDSDLTGHQINTAPGYAADTILGLLHRRALEIDATEAPEAQSSRSRGLPPDIAELLARSVNDGWGGVELRQSIGQHIRTVVWLQPDWSKDQVKRLLPRPIESEHALGAWRSLWAGLFVSGEIYPNVASELQDEYRVLIEDASRPDPRILVDMFRDMITSC